MDSSRELANILSAQFLRAMHQSNQPLAGWSLDLLPLPEARKKEVEACDACKVAFYEALYIRLSSLLTQQGFLCPDTHDLARYANGQTVEDACSIDIHLTNEVFACDACNYYVELLSLTQKR